MADSLLLGNNSIELLGGGQGIPSTLPSCLNAVFTLSPEFDLGAPQPVVQVVESMILNGEVLYGDRSSNRTVKLPIAITAPDRDTLDAALETLMALIDQEEFTLTWTRDGGLPLIFDCFRNMPAEPVYDLIDAQQFSAGITVQFQAFPFGRSDVTKQLTFMSPLIGTTAPPSPVTLDPTTSVASLAQWSLSSKAIVGSNSVKWNPGASPANNPEGDGMRADYHTTFSNKNITGLTSLSFWAGLGSEFFFFTGFGPTSFAVTLADSHGATISFGLTQYCNVSSNINSPNWTFITLPIPQGNSGFDYTTVTGYEIVATNYHGFGGGQMLDVVFYLNDIVAVPATTGQAASVRGAIYNLLGITGTAAAPISLQVQQAPESVPQSVTFSTPGSFQWIAPNGVANIKAEPTGGGGAGSSLTTTGFGGGGKGGEYAAEPSGVVSEGNVYSGFVGAGGTAGSVPVNGADSWIQLDAVLVTGHGGHSAAAASATGATAANGTSSNTTVEAGGNGATGSTTGGGGGSSGGSAAPGNAGSGVTGGSAPTGGGAGGNGGAAGNHPGVAGSVPGGAGGGACSTGTAEAGGVGAAGQVKISWTQTQGTFETLVIHRPSKNSPPSLTPFVSVGNGSDTPDNSIQYLVPSLVAGVNAGFRGTYSMMLVGTFASVSSSHTVTVTVYQYEYPGGPSSTTTVSRTFVPNDPLNGAPNGMISIGELTLPYKDMAPDNTQSYFAVSILSSNTSDRFLDLLILDTEGQTVWIDESTGYVIYYIDEPTTDVDLGRVMGSAYDRSTAVSVLDFAFLSGGPMTVDPGNNTLLAYCKEGAPALVAYYYERWYLNRVGVAA